MIKAKALSGTKIVSNNKNEIIINGKRYDARTGRSLDSAADITLGTAMDGVVRRKAPTPHRKPSHTAKAVHSHIERSKTLMRTAVSKPKAKKISSKAAPVNSHAVAVRQEHDKRHVRIPVHRQERAAKIAKSSLVSKFGSAPNPHKPTVTFKTAPLDVQPAPAEHRQHHKVHQIHRPVEHFHNPFAHAIENATTHQQAAIRKKRAHHKVANKLQITPRSLGAGAFLVSAILLAGFTAYQNVPNMALKVAASKAGVQAALPHYNPAGFRMNGHIKYSPGQITLQYKSATDERAFQLTQKKTAWDNETLRQNFVSNADEAYQTYQENGKTVYVYDDANATWVEEGVWYQIEGNSGLSGEQLLRIASSL